MALNSFRAMGGGSEELGPHLLVDQQRLHGSVPQGDEGESRGSAQLVEVDVVAPTELGDEVDALCQGGEEFGLVLDR